MRRVDHGPPRHADRENLRRRIAGVEPGQAARVPFTHEHCVRHRVAQGQSVFDRTDGQHAARTRGHRMRRDRKGAEHVDDERDAARAGGACHVIDHVNLHVATSPAR